jgi:DNA-directed RNA polymerase I, II, and III subunit RPABC1
LGKQKKSKSKAKSDLNVLSYFLVPKMEILSEDAKKKVLEKYKIGESQLPRFRLNDPTVRSLNAKAGDVIRIERQDSTGSYHSYRIVVA